MNDIFIYSMILSILMTYIVGNVSKILRNIFILIIYFYSVVSIFSQGGINFDFKAMPFDIIDIGFRAGRHGILLSFLNHLIFLIYLIRDLFKEKHESESSYFMNMLFLFFFSNMLFFSKNIETSIIVFEIAVYFMLFLMATNLNDRKTMNDLVFVNSILTAAFILSLIFFKSGISASSSVFLSALIGRVFMIPLNTKLFDSLKKASIILLGYLMSVIFISCISLYDLLTNILAYKIDFRYSYLVFVPFLFLSVLKAISSRNLKYTFFHLFIMTISFQLSFSFLQGTDISFIIVSAGGSLLSIAVLFTTCDKIEEIFSSTDLTKLESIHNYMPLSFYLFAFSFVSLSYFPLSISALSNPLFISAPLAFKLIFVFYVFSVWAVFFKIIALLFFTDAPYKTVSRKIYPERSGEYVFYLFLLMFSILALTMSLGFHLELSGALGSESSRKYILYPNGIFSFKSYVNLASILFIIIYIKTSRFYLHSTKRFNGEFKREIKYSDDNAPHMLERNINLNGLNFYGFDEQKLVRKIKYADLDNIVRLVGRTFTDIGGFIVKLYQRSMSAVLLILLIYISFILVFIGGGK
ncbi:MAG: hypothetical protein AB7T10_05775 [bacterium]